MSAIAGVVRHDGGAADASRVQAMLEAMGGRIPHGSGVSARGPAALGKGLLRTTPQDGKEDLPHAGDDLLTAAHVRVDNRGELRDGLEASGRTVPPEATDPRLVAEAYRGWGAGFVDEVVGPFAVAIWDEAGGELHLARDFLGVKPLHVHRTGERTAFATEVKALLALEEVDPRLREDRLLDHLTRTAGDPTITWYAGVERVPPASIVSVDEDGSERSETWWRPGDVDRSPSMSMDEAARGLRDRLREATRARARTAGEGDVGAFASGGLDSTSVAALLREIRPDGDPFPAMSWRFPRAPEAGEETYAEAFLDRDGVTPLRLRVEDEGPLGGLQASLPALDAPAWAPNLFLHRASYEAFARRGVRVVLDGLDGDTVVGHGYARLAELARSGRWIELLRNAQAVADQRNRSTLGVVLGRGLRPNLPAWLPVVGHDARGRSLPPEAELLEASARDRARERLEAFPEGTEEVRPRDVDQHRAGLSSGLISHLLEAADHVAAHHHVEPRYPFFDRRVVEHCLRVPGRHRLRGGSTRAFLREAMEGILPEAVRTRPGKADLSPAFRAGLEEVDLAGDASVVERAVDELDPWLASGGPSMVSELEDLPPLPRWSLLGAGEGLRFLREERGLEVPPSGHSRQA